jgi:excisionase family DNA binding protein
MTAADDMYVQGMADEIAEKVAAILLAARDDRPLLTVDQAAERLGMGKKTLEERMARGELPWVQVGLAGTRGARKIEPAELDKFIAARRQTVDPQEGARA